MPKLGNRHKNLPLTRFVFSWTHGPVLSPITAPMTSPKLSAYTKRSLPTPLRQDRWPSTPTALLNDLSVHDILLAGDEAEGHHN